MTAGLPIQIVGQHPHAGEFGVLVSGTEAERLGRKRKLNGGSLVVLENCAHGTECCYVWPGDFRTGCERRS